MIPYIEIDETRSETRTVRVRVASNKDQWVAVHSSRMNDSAWSEPAIMVDVVGRAYGPDDWQCVVEAVAAALAAYRAQFGEVVP